MYLTARANAAADSGERGACGHAVSHAAACAAERVLGELSIELCLRALEGRDGRDAVPAPFLVPKYHERHALIPLLHRAGPAIELKRQSPHIRHDPPAHGMMSCFTGKLIQPEAAFNVFTPTVNILDSIRA